LPHRGQFNIALFTAAPNEENATAPRLATRDKRLRSILDAAGESWTPWPLYTVAAPNWHRGNIGIIGDAAHAMVPFQAQGAAMAIEDAGVLAPLLTEEPQAETAFARFESLRRQRVERVARQSRQNGTIFHLPWPAALARNMVIKAQGPRGHIDRLDWLYGYDPMLEAPQTGSGPTA
jgi:salicylate hydroxylase